MRRIVNAKTLVLLAAALIAATTGLGCGRLGGEAGASPASTSGNDRVFMRVLGNEDLAEVDARTGAVERRRLPVGCGDTPHCLIASGENLIVSGVGETVTLDASVPGRGRFTPVGNGWITVPSQEPGAVWLGILGRGRNSNRKLSAVREVDLEGNFIRSMKPPEGRWPMESTDQGLLFQYLDSVRLWSFDERTLTEKLPGPFPADTDGSLVASCDDPCRELAITDLASGTRRLFMPPGEFTWQAGYDGAFSPGGDRFVAPVGGRSRTRGLALAMVDLEAGSVEIVPGSRGLESWYRSADWSPSGQTLYWSNGKDVLFAYDAEDEETIRVTDLDLGKDGRVMQLVVVEGG